MTLSQIIVTSRYLKSGTQKSKNKRRNYTKYIATRETVEVRDQNIMDRNDNATKNQEQLLNDLLSDFPEAKKYLEYEDYTVNPTVENASELISTIIERNADVIGNRQNFVGYMAMRPGVQKRGSHGLFNEKDEPIILEAGAREAYLIEEPMAAAIGAGLPVQEATGSMVVDIGGGTCEVAVISLGGIVVSKSVRCGGDAIDSAIVRYIRKAFNMFIGERTAENIKIEIGTAMKVDEPAVMEVRGRDLLSGLPKSIEVNANHVCEAVNEPVSMIVDAVRNTLERTPPELSADIMDRGIVMTGGSSMLRNLDRLISQETGMPVFVSDEALNCVALGTGIAVENIDIYRKGFMTSK